MRKNGYVIIEGNIGAGKSTFAQALTKRLRGEDCTAQYLAEPDETNNPFLPLYYSDPKRWAYTMQTHLLSKRYEMTQYAQHGALSGKGWFVMDRSYFGDLYFANVQMKDGFFTEAEYASYVSMHKAMQANIHFPTAAIFLEASPSVCLQRINKRMSEKAGRKCESSIAIEYLESLQKEIDKLKAFLATQTTVISLPWNNEQTEDDIYISAYEIALKLVHTSPTKESPYSPWGACATDIFEASHV